MRQDWSATAGMGKAYGTILGKDRLGEMLQSKAPNPDGAGKLQIPREASAARSSNGSRKARADRTQGHDLRRWFTEPSPSYRGRSGATVDGEGVGEGESVWTSLSVFRGNPRASRSQKIVGE